VQKVRRGARLFVIDPRAIELCSLAEHQLPLRPGTNVALLNAIAKIWLDERRLDEAFVAERCEGFEALEGFLAGVSVEEAAATCRLDSDAVRHFALALADAGPALYVTGLGLSEQTQGVASVQAIANLALLSGAIGRPGTGLLPLRGQNNVQGNADMGSTPDLLTGYRDLTDASLRAHFEALWGRALPAQPGFTLPEMLEAAEHGRLRALWVQGEDLAQSDPHQSQVLKALERLELLVVQELFLTETARRAHLILPAASVLEQDGTFTNGERRIQRLRPALPPPGQARPDWRVIRDAGVALGLDWSYPSAADVLDEIAQAAPALFGGVSAARLEGDGLQWPCPSADHPGTPRLHVERFARGRAELVAHRYRESPEGDVAGFPFTLVTGRVRDQYNVGTMTRRTPLNQLAPCDWLELAPGDFDRLGLRDGETVRVSSRWGETRVAARRSARIVPGTCFLSFHHPESHTNRLTGPQRDPGSGCPEYKVTAVRVERILPA
jgi:predicted molibdopterin-dependent oxidoreductase YjgC